MRPNRLAALLPTVLALGLAAGASAERLDAAAALEKLKALEGTWTGSMGEGEGRHPYTVQWEVTAGGSAVIERQFTGDPHEMVTVYHLDGSDLLLTHYCAVGNQPTMKARSIGDQAIRFAFLRGTNMDRKDGHMHEAVIHFVDDDHLRAEWTYWEDGRPSHPAIIEVRRQRG